MSIKKLLLSALLLTTTGFAYAQQTTEDYIKIDDLVGDNAIVAGVDEFDIDDEDTYGKLININLINSSPWVAFQFDLWIPEEVEIGFVDGDPLIWNTERLTYKKSGKTKDFSYAFAPQDDGKDEDGNKYKVWRIVAYNDVNSAIKSAAENDDDPAIFQIHLFATDQATTGTYTAYIKDAILSNSDSEIDPDHPVVTGASCPMKESSFKIQINAKIGKGGYGTFSWPRDVDFTGVEGVEEVCVAEGPAKNGWLHLTAVESMKIPAGTGVFIKGTAGAIVNPETAKGDVASVSSTLGETSTAALEAGDNVFALATKNGKTALYPVTAGVVIPKYKAYMTDAEGAKFISFGDTATSIDALDMAEEDGDIYTLGGQKVQKTTMKGVYIKNGQKVVVK
jgi:hypothetical protein